MSSTDSKINVVVVGHGKLANAIVSTLPKLDRNKGCLGTVQTYDGQTSFTAPTIMIHVGSGRQYQECLALALKRRCVFIQAATQKDIPMEPPVSGEIVYVNAPNLDLRLIKFFCWLKSGASFFQNDEITVTESHQAGKASVPGTAYKICDILGVDHSKVVSIRNPDLQRDLKIKTLEQHAYHEIVIGSGDSQIRMETRIEGSAPYVEGLYEILKSITGIPVSNYEIEELVAKGFIL